MKQGILREKMVPTSHLGVWEGVFQPCAPGLGTQSPKTGVYVELMASDSGTVL